MTLGALVIAELAVLATPEVRSLPLPRPRYRPQRLAFPAASRDRFLAASSGAFLCFAAYGMFAGLAGTILAGSLHHPSSALVGLTIFVTYGSGALVQTATTTWPSRTLLAAGVSIVIAGLATLTVSTWTVPPSLGLFILGGALIGAGGGAIFRAGLVAILEGSTADDRAGSLATFFAAGFAGLSVPVIGLGIALQHLSARVTLLIFALVIGAGLLTATPVLLGHPASRS